jgi:hypothetical protein
MGKNRVPLSSLENDPIEKKCPLLSIGPNYPTGG